MLDDNMGWQYLLPQLWHREGGKALFSFIFILTLEWDLQKGEYERNKTKQKNNKRKKLHKKQFYIYSGVKSQRHKAEIS